MNKLLSFNLIIIVAITMLSCSSKGKTIVINEPAAPQPVSPVQNWQVIDKPCFEWGCSNERYHREYIPGELFGDAISLTAWRNERLNAQAVIWTNEAIENMRIEMSALKSKNGSLINNAINHFYIRNVISDEFLGGCGYKTKQQKTAHLVPDCFEQMSTFKMRGQSARGIWFTIDIPKNAISDTYSCDITLFDANRKIKKIELEVNVINRTLPDASDWSYHLDLWQNPYAVARIHNVDLWSEEHFELMRPLYKRLANAGQKCITATIVHKAWGGQTYDPFDSMVKHTLRKDGTWEYDYSIFDNWVDFMMGLGIKKQIKCFSLIPWENRLAYYDEAAGRDTFIVAKPSSKAFVDYWSPFLNDFKNHLNHKGWFDITTIAMDERPMKDMIEAIQLIRENGNFKIASAANYNPGLSDNIDDLSVESRHVLPDSIIEKRRSNGQISTYYVCCSAEYPNNFTYSKPAEGVWQAWYTYANNLDGFLRWAYNSWVEDPLNDTRFITWPAGDTFFVYPDSKSSIRFEKLREGIQDYEKLNIIVNELEQSNKPESQIQLNKIHKLLNEFKVSSIRKNGAKSIVDEGKNLLNGL